MSPSPLDGARKHLVNQLVYFDEHFTAFIEQYYPDPFARERMYAEKKLRQYAEVLENVLSKDDLELSERFRSIALIGSRVNVRFEDDGTEESFTIVHPAETDPDYNKISCLSPVGRQLLLAEVNSSLELETPVGMQPVRIRQIEYAYIGGFAD